MPSEQMSLRHLTVYYPDHVLARSTYELPNEVPCRSRWRRVGWVESSRRYHDDKDLKTDYDISRTQDTTWTYYEEDNDHSPARSGILSWTLSYEELKRPSLLAIYLSTCWDF